MSNYVYLDDMEKYDKNFDRSLYEKLSEKDLKTYCRGYYEKNLPVDLLSWCRVNEPHEDMVYKNGYWTQIMFIRDTVNAMLHDTYEKYRANPVMVINTHMSKSIDLPVYEINLKEYGVKFIMRYNFYDWKVSVISKTDIDTDLMGLIDENEVIHPVYCEGFEDNQVFSSYKDNKKEFTFEVRDDYSLYTIMFIINNYFKNKIK